ncbi:TPA: hypothetical protein P0N99_003049, partial [Yersinia enterocolitica]|nr:hypothetical protein [Yersinia enterocolitica]
MFIFKVSDRKVIPSLRMKNTVYLFFSTWNDYSFRTLFNMEVTDSKGNIHNIGQIKIGFKEQNVEVSTYDRIDKEFRTLDEIFFSLAESPEFYLNLYSLGKEDCHAILKNLNDVVISKKAMMIAMNEGV